jgi:hypothetical protein
LGRVGRSLSRLSGERTDHKKRGGPPDTGLLRDARVHPVPLGVPQSCLSLNVPAEGEAHVLLSCSVKSACQRAAVPDTLFHHQRRTAVTNMIRAGVPEKDVMAVSGHLGPSVLRRYMIVKQQDVSGSGPAWPRSSMTSRRRSREIVGWRIRRNCSRRFGNSLQLKV